MLSKYTHLKIGMCVMSYITYIQMMTKTKQRQLRFGYL